MGDYERGFADGFESAYRRFVNADPTEIRRTQGMLSKPLENMRASSRQSKPKRKQSGKQKILTQMAKKAWDKYKKGKGKKSYVDIRAQVSRSLAYKKKTKGM